MPTVRKRVSRRPLAEQITPETIELYRRCLEIIEAGDDDIWEADGGRRAEFHDASNALHRALGLKPWDYSVLWVGDGPPRHWEDPERHARAQELRQALQAALDATG